MALSKANEIPGLIRRLGSRRRPRVDGALARLSVLGARAVDNLIAALEGNDSRIRAQVMPLLAMIHDPRGQAPLIATLLDRSPRMREISARCLAGFPSRDTVAALERVAKNDRYRAVRIAAIEALVAQYLAGQEQAIRLVLATLLDSEELPQIRLASFALLPVLDGSQRKSVMTRLLADPRQEIRDRALQRATLADADSNEATILVLISDLTGDDYGVWIEAVQRLGACGSAVIPPLVAEMRSRDHDPKFCTRAGMALKALGPRRGRSLIGLLEQIDEPLPLQVLVEVIGAWGEKSMIYRLKELLDRIAASGPRPTDAEGFDPMRRVRARAQFELARIGSRVAIRDLREALADPSRRIEPDMLSAVELIGKREELPLLIRVWGQDRFLDERITTVVRTIMKRECIRRNARALHSLSQSERRALHAILPRRRKRTSRLAVGRAEG